MSYVDHICVVYIYIYLTTNNNNIEVKKSTNSIAMCKFSIQEPSVSETSRCQYETLPIH